MRTRCGCNPCPFQMRRTEDGLIPTALAIAGAVQWVASCGGAWLVRATTRSMVAAGKGGMREGRVLSRVSPNSLVHEALLPAPDHGFALAHSASDGGRAFAVSGQNNDPRPPDVLPRAVAIPDDRLADAPRSGKPRRYEAAHERRILAALDEPPPAGYGRWDGTLLARHLGDISRHQIWRVLRRHEISLARRRSWCISTEPAFAQKAADIVALYLQPPENAVVLSVDENPTSRPWSAPKAG